MALRAVPHDCDLLALDQREVCILVVIDLHRASFCSGAAPSMRRRWKSNAQDAFAAADTGAAGAYGLEDRRPVDGLQERIELAGCAGQFDRVRALGDIDDAAAKNI